MKDELINTLMITLNSMFSVEQLQTIKNTLVVLLQNYDVIPTKYELTTNVFDDEKLIQMFLIAKKIDGSSDGTLRLYGTELRRLLHKYIKKSVVEFTKDDIRLHFAKRMIDNPNLSKTSLNNERRYFSSFFSWLVENDYIDKNPMIAVKKIKEEKVIKNPLSEEEIEKMRDCLAQRENNAKEGSKDYIKHVRNSAIFEFLLSTGCRVTELCTAKIKDLDLHDREVKVLGKGSKERICYLNAKSSIKLEKYLKIRNSESPYIFAPIKTSFEMERLDKSIIEVMVRELGKECGIEKVHPHKFRRTSATMALNKGMPIEEVQVMLGHEQMNTTMIYAKVKQKNVKASHEKYM